MIELLVNGRPVRVDAPPETSLLHVLREHLGLTGTKYGCGTGLCGACTVHADGQPVFACQTASGTLAEAEITTIEGLSETGDHPLQRAWIAEQVPQCGYCQPGQIMRAAALLSETAEPTRDEIVRHMAPNLCRCGTYPRIVKAIQRAAREG